MKKCRNYHLYIKDFIDTNSEACGKTEPPVLRIALLIAGQRCTVEQSPQNPLRGCDPLLLFFMNEI